MEVILHQWLWSPMKNFSSVELWLHQLQTCDCTVSGLYHSVCSTGSSFSLSLLLLRHYIILRMQAVRSEGAYLKKSAQSGLAYINKSAFKMGGAFSTFPHHMWLPHNNGCPITEPSEPEVIKISACCSPLCLLMGWMSFRRLQMGSCWMMSQEILFSAEDSLHLISTGFRSRA